MASHRRSIWGGRGNPQAATAVGAHDSITDFENGYDTVLVERGQNLSLGQRQLLSFARAIIADPRILVMDEATARVDSEPPPYAV